MPELRETIKLLAQPGIIPGFVDFSLDLAAYARMEDIPSPEKQTLKHLIWITTIPFFWRTAAHTDRWEFARNDLFKTAAAYAVLITRYDDLIDDDPQRVITPERIKNDSVNQQVLPKFIKYIQSAPASPELKRKFIFDFAQFRRNEFRWHQRLSPIISGLSFSDVDEYREKTCGLNAKIVADLIRLYAPDVSDETAKIAREGSYAVFMHFQVYDDIQDWSIDHGKVPNYLSAALYQNSDELRAVSDAIGNGLTKITYLRTLAPSAFSLCDEVAERYFLMIPEHERSLRRSLVALREYAFTDIKAPKKFP